MELQERQPTVLVRSVPSLQGSERLCMSNSWTSTGLGPQLGFVALGSYSSL